MRGADLQRDGLNERPERHTGKSLRVVWNQLSNSRERNYFKIKKEVVSQKTQPLQKHFIYKIRFYNRIALFTSSNDLPR